IRVNAVCARNHQDAGISAVAELHTLGRMGEMISQIVGAILYLESMMSTYERTAPATAFCLVLVVAALGAFIANYDWPTSRMVRAGFSIAENNILVYDVLPL